MTDTTDIDDEEVIARLEELKAQFDAESLGYADISQTIWYLEQNEEDNDD